MPSTQSGASEQSNQIIIRDTTVEEAFQAAPFLTFEDKREITTKLGIKVYPSEDLKTIKVRCGLSLNTPDNGGMHETSGCRIVTFGLPKLVNRPCQ